MMLAIYWLVAAAVFIVIEILTMGMTSIWFAGGSLVAAAMARFSLPLWSQMVAFIVVSIVILIPVRPLAQKYLNNKTVKTNVDSLIGQIGLVTEEIDNLRAKGQVKVRGQVWTARSVSDDWILFEGEKVKVREISGVKVIVEPVDDLGDRRMEKENSGQKS